MTKIPFKQYWHIDLFCIKLQHINKHYLYLKHKQPRLKQLDRFQLREFISHAGYSSILDSAFSDIDVLQISSVTGIWLSVVETTIRKKNLGAVGVERVIDRLFNIRITVSMSGLADGSS
jgi:hypothetical protein